MVLRPLGKVWLRRTKDQFPCTGLFHRPLSRRNELQDQEQHKQAEHCRPQSDEGVPRLRCGKRWKDSLWYGCAESLGLNEACFLAEMQYRRKYHHESWAGGL